MVFVPSEHLVPTQHGGRAMRTLDVWSRIVTPRRQRALRASLTTRRTGVTTYLVSAPRVPSENG
ncbi:hypothetical protein ACFZCK_15305 [Kitasatospora purpeofusca]|uniref:hypothetical protein n=1 Tax=Kitasatospora purpeofusca TaxID=67352 RepID=UPI0036E9AAF7